MTVDEILGRLSSVRKQRLGWKAKCPAHTDDRASLSINQGNNGKTLLHCHAGCSVVDVTAALGLQIKDLFPQNGEGSRSEIEATYDYVENGNLLFQVVRLFPKSFRQRKPDGHGGWEWKLGKVRRVLYRLPQVVEAIFLGKEVFIPEGEKDADRLASLGLAATTSAGGVSKWRSEYTKTLRGASVVIVPDNDGPGEDHAVAVARSLDGVAQEVRILRLPNLPPKGDVSDWLDAGGTVEELCSLAGAAPIWSDSGSGEGLSGDPEPGRAGEEDRSVIQVREKLTGVTKEAIDALTERPGLGLFVRGRRLVTVGRDGSMRQRWLKRPPGSPLIVPVEPARMLGMLDAAAEWRKWSARKKEHVPARPPDWVAAQILALMEWPLPYLEAVVEMPTMRPDGTILETPGYDDASGLLYEPIPGDPPWPGVPEQPTRKDARQAVEALCGLVADFPFVADSDKAAYVTAFLTLVVRHLIEGPVPMFSIRAPTPGTGKSLLASVIVLIGTGREPAIMTMPKHSEELRKRITSLVLAGTPSVILDNVSGVLGSDVLAAAITATEWEDRILGRSEMVRLPCRLVWLATGNNFGFGNTLGRRVVPIDLDAQIENPEARSQFANPDLLRHVRQHRVRYVADALTLMRAFHLAGRPHHGGSRVGSFEAWDDLIRSAVIWAGLEDPAASDDATCGRGRIRAQGDDDLDQLGALLETLSSRYPDEVPFSTADVISKAKDNNELAGLLDTAAGPKQGGHATTGSLGATFRGYRDRPLGGLVLRRHRRSWSIQKLDQADT